jgi:GNAT superfamily N-acetyltransferase
MPLEFRPTAPSDAEACGRTMFLAFQSIAREHGFLPDFPSEEAATGLAGALIGNPAVFGVVAELDGRVVGSNFLSEADAIRGVGPITVAPDAQGRGIGRRLMQQVLGRGKDASGIRLLQDTFNMGSYGLYASLGFEVREPVLVLSGRPKEKPATGWRVRAMTAADLEACDRLCLAVHGLSRRHELEAALGRLAPLVAECDDRIVAYMTAPNFWIANHGVAASDVDLQALIAGAGEATDSVSFLLPTRQGKLFRWCLEQGLRAVKPMTLMSLGDYREPSGTYLPSVFY